MPALPDGGDPKIPYRRHEARRGNALVDPGVDDRPTHGHFDSGAPDLGFETLRHELQVGLARAGEETLQRAGELIAVDEECVVPVW